MERRAVMIQPEILSKRSHCAGCYRNETGEDSLKRTTLYESLCVPQSEAGEGVAITEGANLSM